ncbi:MAG: ankyrin repeat domain-containing protein [Nakamurella sp.]
MRQRPFAVLGALALLIAGCTAVPPNDQGAGTAAGPSGQRQNGAGIDEPPSAPTNTVPSATPPTGPDIGQQGSTSSPPASSPLVTPSLPESPVPPRNLALDPQLIDAAWANDVSAASDLISRGADVNAKDGTVQSAYLIATSEGYLDLLELTLANGADVTSLDSYNGTGLIRAAERGHADVVGRLLRAGIAVNHVNRPGWTALDEAIVYGDGGQDYLDTVRALVAGGADVERISGAGQSPVQHAVDNGFSSIQQTLQGAIDAASTDPVQATVDLLDAAAAGDADAVAIALRAGASIEATDDHGRTPLLLAAAADRVDAARLLVVLGADPDAQDAQLDSAWLVTGVTGSVPMLETLLPAHPDLNLRNRFGGLSVIPASERGHVDYVRRVVSTGINVNHINDLGWTAMLEAVVYGDGSEPYQQIVGILLAAGADPGIADANGRTALEHAQAMGYDGIAAQLLSGR